MNVEMKRNIYTVKTADFEGPFRLLLDLIEKRKLFINDVSLAAVTEDYFHFMNKLGGLSSISAAEISNFVLVASTLILIKSKSLLPNLSLTAEEEGDIKNLEERLRLYELFTRLQNNIKINFGQKIIFAPLERKNEILVFLPDARITQKNMMGFAKITLQSIPKKASMPAVEVRKVISIEEMIGQLILRIQDSIKVSFKDFTGQAKTREEKIFVIVGFLAMLELVRNGILHVVQENDFADIIIEKKRQVIGNL